MGTLQNLADRFWITIGKTEKVYPVVVEKHQLIDHGGDDGKTLKLDGLDRGRTLIEDDGRKKFELMGEPNVEGFVAYEDFNQDLEGSKYVSVAIDDRDNILPLSRHYDINEDYEGSGIGELEYCVQVNRRKEWAIRDFQESASIVESGTEKWWQQEKFQAAILFVSAGLFFIFVGFAAGETYLKEITDQLGQNTEALQTLQDQISQNLGGGN